VTEKILIGRELLPCPFCSCVDIGEVVINASLSSKHRRFKVYCKACQCRTSEHKTKKESRLYWNSRAALAAPQHTYSQGVSDNYAVILCDGAPITVEEVVARLNGAKP
jgi:hypothetical protein